MLQADLSETKTNYGKNVWGPAYKFLFSLSNYMSNPTGNWHAISFPVLALRLDSRIADRRTQATIMAFLRLRGQGMYLHLFRLLRLKVNTNFNYIAGTHFFVGTNILHVSLSSRGTLLGILPPPLIFLPQKSVCEGKFFRKKKVLHENCLHQNLMCNFLVSDRAK